jgi:hypothetical protein
VDAGLRLGAMPLEIDQARQEAGERLAAAGRGDEQRVAALARQVEKPKLVGVRAPAARGEPAGERLGSPASAPASRLFFNAPIVSTCLTLPFSFTNSGHD